MALAETMGADGRRLFEAVCVETRLPWVPDLEAVETLRRVWLHHDPASEHGGRLARRGRPASLRPGHHLALRDARPLPSEEKHESRPETAVHCTPDR